MSTPTPSWGTSVSQHLRATKKFLQDVTFGARTATGLDMAEFDVLEQDTLEVLRLIRSWRNTVAPINRTPPEILALVPDLWDTRDRDQDIITLTHVCRLWREVFISRPSLWTNLDCVGLEKTLVYLERSKLSPINLSLSKDDILSPYSPFIQIIPHAIGRLKSLSIEKTPRNVQDITAHLSRPAPLLEKLSIRGDSEYEPQRNPVLTSTLFDGDLTSLRMLCLECVHTELPWRNMTNLTSFMLAHTSPGKISLEQFLDFFESAPHLREVKLHSTIPTSGVRSGRLVSLACLKRMVITGGVPSVFLDRLLIPVGAKLTTQKRVPHFLIEEHLPRSLDNLRNFSDFTAVELCGDNLCSHIQFSGPNGKVTMIPGASLDGTRLVFESLAQFDTSKIVRLKIDYGDSPSSDLPYQTLLPLTNLRTLVLSRCQSPRTFIHALHPSVTSLGVVVCPKLEELVFIPTVYGAAIDIKHVIGIAAVRTLKGVKLESVRIVSWGKFAERDILELKQLVSHVECGPDAGGACGDGDDSDEED